MFFERVDDISVPSFAHLLLVRIILTLRGEGRLYFGMRINIECRENCAGVP